MTRRAPLACSSSRFFLYRRLRPYHMSVPRRPRLLAICALAISALATPVQSSHHRRMKMRLAVALAFAIVSLGPAAAAAWRPRAIPIIAPSPRGGAADMFGRLLCEHFGEAFHERCFVENRAGAGGLLRTAATAQAAPAGHKPTTPSHAHP